MLTEVTEALNARVEEREELLRQAKIMEKQLNNELQEVKSMNVTLQDMNNRLREENESIKTKDDEIASLKETIEQKNLIEDQLDNAKKLLAKMKKKFAVFREEKQAELEKKDEDISQLLDRVAEVESIRRIEGEKVDEQIKQLSERIIEAEVVNEKVIKGKNEEIRGMLEKISQMENANEEAIQAKVVEIGQMSERVRVAELQHERIIKEKNEIAGMKEDLQIELDHANEFMVSQIALLKQELLESQKSLAESESEVELLRERLSSNEEQLTELHEIENGLLKQLQEKDNELERLRLEREKDKSSVAVEEMSATNVEVSESMIEEEAPLTTRDDGTSLKSLLEDKELALKEQGQQLQMIAKKFTALRKKFGQQKDQMKDISEVNKRLKEEKEELSKMYGGVSDRLAEYQDLSEQKKVLENALNSKERALELLNSDVKRLQESIAVLEGEKRNVEISLARSEEEVTSFRGQLDVMSEQLDFMAKQRGALTEEVNLKDGEIHSLLRKLEESKVLAQKKEQELEQIKKSMDEEYSTHSETLALWKSHVESYVGEISELQKELQEKNKLVHENDAEITSLRVELNDVILQKEQLKSTLQVKVDEERAYEEAAEGLATLKEEYEEQGMEIFSLKQELQQARQQIEAMDELVEQKRSLEGLLEVREVEMNDLRCQSTDVRNLKEQVNAKDQELQQLQEVLEEKSAVERKLAVEVESLREEVGNYVQQIADLEGTASDQSLGNDLQEQLDRDVLQIQELQEVLKQKSTIEERLSGEVDSLRTELSRSSRRIAELESSLTEQSLGDDLREQLDRKDIELQQLKSLLNEKSAIERKLSNEMECFKAERIESSLRIAELENSVRQQNLTDDLQARLQDAQEKVVKLTDALEQSQRNAEEIEGKYDELRLEKCSLEEILDNKEQELSYLRDVMAKCANLEKSEAKKDEELARSRQSQASQDDMIRNLRSELGLKNAEITALEDKMNVFEHLSEELRTAKTRIEELEKMLEESSSKGELKDVSQVEKRGVGSSNEGLKESEKQDHVSMQEKLTVMDKERLQFRKKLATMKKASIEIGKQNKQLQSVLDEKEKEISDLKILVNETKNRENELTNTVRDLKSDKEAVEAEFEDTVKELKELVKEKQDLVQERNNLNQVVQRLEAEKDWNKSEAENLREDLEVKTRECSTLKKELDTMKTSLEDQIKKKIEDLVMENDLEKAECEEQFARQINDVCAQKDKIISQLRDSSAELSTVKQQEIDNLKDLLEKKDMIINRFKDNVTTEIHDGSNPDDTDQTLQDTMSIKDELIEQLTEEVRNLKDEIQIVGDGREALDKKLHQALMEKQKLHEQLQLLGEERDKLSQKQQNSINNQGSQKDVETTIQQKDKVISAMKKKIKELRREKAAAELKSKRDEEEKGLELIRGQSVEDPHVIQEFYQKTEQDVVQAVDGIKDKNDLEVNYEKLTDELTHVRHERNVYEESYIQLQRDLDQSQKENESLRAEIQSNQSIIDGFDSKLEKTTTSMKKEFQDHIKEREKSMSELHGKERSMMENFMEKLRREKLRMESEMTKIQEDQESLLKDKEEISKRNSEMKHTLDTAVEQLETTREELNSLKVSPCYFPSILYLCQYLSLICWHHRQLLPSP